MAEEEGASSKSSRIWRKTASWVHRKTADVLQDYPDPKVPDEPSLRIRIRLVVTALVMVSAVVTISFVYSNAQSSRTVRHWGSAYLLTLPTSEPNYPNLLCPCNKPSVQWPYFISFYWINLSAGQTSLWNRHPISNYTDFCDTLRIVTDNSTTGAWLQGCYLMAQSISASTNVTTQTSISTNSVTLPSALCHIISVQMQGALADVFENHAYLISSSFGDWVQLLHAKQLLSRAAYRLVKSAKMMGDANHTNSFYWRFFQEEYYSSPPNGTHVRAFDLTGERALVLEMNWALYVKQCNPSYCDQVVRNSLLRRFVTALVQVGGFAAVMMLVLRGAVWPCIRLVNRWS